MRQIIYSTKWTKCYILVESEELNSDFLKKLYSKSKKEDECSAYLNGRYRDAFEFGKFLENLIIQASKKSIKLEIHGHISVLYYFIKSILWRNFINAKLEIIFIHKTLMLTNELFLLYMEEFVKSLNSYEVIEESPKSEPKSKLLISQDTREANNLIFQSQFSFLDHKVVCKPFECSNKDLYIDFIVPTKDVDEEDVTRCILSILENKKEFDTVYLIDDNQGDSSLSLDFRKIFQNKIQIIRGRHKGISDTRNLGLSLGSNKLVSFIDSDDFVISDFINIQREFHSFFTNVAATGTWLRAFGLHNRIYPQWDNISILGVLKCLPPAGVLMWKRNAIEELGGFDIEFSKGFEDYNLVAKASSKNFPICVLDEPLYRYQRRNGSLSNSLTAREESDLYVKVIAHSLLNSDLHKRESLVRILRNYGSYYPNTPLDMLNYRSSLYFPFSSFEVFMNKYRNSNIRNRFINWPTFVKVFLLESIRIVGRIIDILLYRFYGIF